MLDCLILGDSLAVGVGQARPGCTTAAKVGITSGAYVQTLQQGSPRAARHVVISLGVNDDPSMDTAENLRRLRRAITAPRVTWLLPGLKDGTRQTIRTVAAERDDAVVDTISQVGPDRLHPGQEGYRRIAGWTEQGVSAPALTASTPAVRLPGVRPPVVPGTALRQFASGPLSIPMPGAAPRIPVLLPLVQTPGSIYGAVSAGPFAAIPPRDYAFRAFGKVGN